MHHITKELFATAVDGREVYLYTVDNGNGMSAEFINLGCIIRKITVPDKNSNPTDVVLGRETYEEYLNNSGYYGAAVGRVANRIRDAHFELNGTEYKVSANRDGYCLHGGFESFAQKIWTECGIDDSNMSVSFELTSPDGDEGFPGDLHCVVTYTLTEDNALKINYEAVSDKDTIVNFTNHSYFNLNGHNSGNILGHRLCINADFYTPSDDSNIPTGEILKVEGTPFDFTGEKEVGRDIDSDYPTIAKIGTYDHNWVLRGRGLREVASLVGDKSGIRMKTFTDKPGMQIYVPNKLDGRVSKGGAVYADRGAICLETQLFPNGAQLSHFPSPILRCGDKYDYTTVYSFDVEK